MPLRALRHPAVRAWFEAEFAAPASCQARAWPRIRGGGHALIAAPTGSGKTLAGFGNRQTVPGAVISGVFNPANLETAQAEGLAIIWSHRLSDLTDFIESTRAT